MGLILNRRREMGGEALPYDAQILYLQSTGTQLIDCSVNPSGATTATFKGKSGYSQANGRMFMAGDGNANLSHYCEFSSNNFGAFQAYVSATLSANTLYDVEMTINGSSKTDFIVTINGQAYSISTTSYQGAINNQFYLFGINSTYKSPAGLRMSNCQILVNGNVARDFIPVRVGSTGYMYDKVSGTLFGNSGSGSFTLGPDV